MQNRLATLVLAAIAGALPGAAQHVYTTSAAPQAIADAGGTLSACQSIVVPAAEDQRPCAVAVEVSVDHTWIGDLALEVQSPMGTRLTMLNRPCHPASTWGCDDDLVAGAPVLFADDAPSDVPAEQMGSDCTGGVVDGSAGCVLSYTPYPDEGEEPFPANGYSFSQFQFDYGSSGTWTLCAGDAASPDPGTLHSWRLIVNQTADGCAVADEPSVPPYCSYGCSGATYQPADGAGEVPLQPSFSWQCVHAVGASCVRYVVQASTPSGTPLQLCDTTSTDCTSAVALQPGQEYSWWVTASPCAGGTPLCTSETASFTTGAVAATSSCDDGLVLDDGTAEGFQTLGAYDQGALVQRFTPPQYPWAFDRVCVGWSRGTGATSVGHAVVLYWQGQRYAVPAGTTEVPLWPEVGFVDTAVAEGFPIITSGSVYVGAEWAAGQAWAGVAVDRNGGAAADVQLVDESGVWHPFPPTEVSALLVRASGSQVGPPQADFTWVPSSPTAGQEVLFRDLSDGNPTSWSWSFGDGGTSIARHPTHTFATAGSYTVTLTAANTLGADTESRTVTVLAGPPTASFSWSPAAPVVGATVQFTDTSTGPPTSWSWSFGDGATSTAANPTHAYAAPGSYAVDLTVANAAGSDQVRQVVTVAEEEPPLGGPEVRVSPPDEGTATLLAAAVDRQGRRVVVWQATGGAKGAVLDGEGVYGRLFGADDQPVGGKIPVDTGSTPVGKKPTVSFDADGDFVVGWEKGGEGVYGRVFSSTGQPSGDSFAVDDQPATEPASDPATAVASSGRFVTAWNSPSGIRVRSFAADGTPAGPSQRVDTAAAGSLSAPAVACDATGRFAVVWHQLGAKADGEGDGVYGRFFGSGGAPVGPPQRLNDDATGDALSPSVGADAQGTMVVAWTQSSTQGQGFDVYARRFSPTGAPLARQQRVNSRTAGRQAHASVAVNAAGDFAVAWESRAGKGLGDGDGVYGRFFGADGSPTSGDFQVAPVEGDLTPVEPEVEVADDDSVTVAYAKADPTGAGAGVFYRTFDAASPNQSCAASDTRLCLNGQRFEVEVVWRDYNTSTSGAGRAVPLTGDTGTFWFFSSANVELVVKVLDGRWLNGHYWVFYGALSDVEYSITVTDTELGGSVTYFNPAHTMASVADTSALPGSAASPPRHELKVVRDGTLAGAPAAAVRGSARTEAAGITCTPGPEALCLNDERFRVEVDWRNYNDGSVGAGQAVALTDDTGTFWFFSSANVELVVKVLDGRPINGHYWVFYGALSDVEYTITVTDTATGQVRTYFNPAHTMASAADTAAFAAP